MYNRPRVIPVLGIIGDDLVKTEKYQNPRYLGDPINAVKIFNGKYVDELVLCDIRSSLDKTPINFMLLQDIASQAFMPLGYGGGIKTFEDVKKLFKIGYEKVIFSTGLFNNTELIKQCVSYAGSQSVVGSIDVKKMGGGYSVYIESGTKKITSDIRGYIKRAVELGVGEIIINSIDREAEMNGYDLDLIKLVASDIDIPIVISGGAGKKEHFAEAIQAGAHAVAAGSMFVYYGSKKAVLITFTNYEWSDLNESNYGSNIDIK